MVNGLLGAGSGIIVIGGLRAAMGESLCDSRDLFANATAVILVISAFSAAHYFLAGALPPGTELGRYLIPGMLGGLVGAVLLEYIRPAWLRRIFSAVVVFSGLMVLLR